MASVGRVRGVPVRLHPSLLLFLPVLAWLAASGPFRGAGSLLAWLQGGLLAAGLLGSLLVHGLAHAQAAGREGSVPRRLTLLPVGERLALAHPLPDPGAQRRVALAGPVASLGLGALAYALAALPAAPPLVDTLRALAAANLLLGLANLALPAWPLDAGPLLRALLAPRVGRADAARFASAVAHACALVLAVWGLLAGDWLLLVLAALVLLGARRGEEAPARPLRVRDLLARAMPGIPATATVEAARERMRDARLPFLPVVSDRRPVGVVRQEDVDAVDDAERWWTPVGALVRSGYRAFSPSDDGEEALEALGRGAPVLVVDAEGRLVGFLAPLGGAAPRRAGR